MPNLSVNHLDIKQMIDRVEFTPVITAITFKDGSGSFAVRSQDDVYDAEKGFAFALLNRLFGQDFWKQVRGLFPASHVKSWSKDEIFDLVCERNALREDVRVLEEEKEILQERIDSLILENDTLKEELDSYENSYDELFENFKELAQEKKNFWGNGVFRTSTPIEPKAPDDLLGRVQKVYSQEADARWAAEQKKQLEEEFKYALLDALVDALQNVDDLSDEELENIDL